MTEADRVRALLTAEADRAGEFVAPPLDDLLLPIRRPGRRRLLLAVAASIVTVVGVAALVVVLRGSGAPQPAAHPVGASELSRYRWSSLPPAPIGPRVGAASGWTGSELIVWGGRWDHEARSDGARFDPATSRWTRLPPAPLAARFDAVSGRLGNSFVVWGGLSGESDRRSLTDGALYDPSTDRWQALPPAPVPADDWAAASIVGDRLVLMYGSDRDHVVHVAQYGSGNGHWGDLSAIALPAEHYVQFAAIQALGATVAATIGWSGRPGPVGPTVDTDPPTTSVRWSATLHSWRRTTSLAVGSGEHVPAGRGLIFFPPECSGCDHPVYPDFDGTYVDLMTGVTRVMAHAGIPAFADYVWTGGALLGLRPEGPTRDRLPRAWDPSANRWTALHPAPASWADDDVVVWTGRELLVWGLGTPTGGHPGGIGLRFGPR